VRLFILGAPRSGTTVVGAFLASHPKCFDLGEFLGFYMAYAQVPSLMRRAPSPLPVKEGFFDRLACSARAFADENRDQASAAFWCDQTPWNLLIAEQLARDLADAIFVLLVRHYRGVILSLRRSYADGYRWAGREFHESARLWARFYDCVELLPADRTIVLSYDALCADPEPNVARLEREIGRRFGVDPTLFDRRAFLEGHARQGPDRRQPMGVEDGGEVRLQPIPPYEMEKWTQGMEIAASPYVSKTHAMLSDRFGQIYATHPPLVAELH
jgi:hypothetical protein